MSASPRKPWTQQQFFAWAETQDGRYEFDGVRPVAMTGGSLNRNLIAHNIWSALRARLRGTGCRPFGMDAGVATIGDIIRYPDAVVTCAKVLGESRLVPDPVIVFEVLSPTSGRMDRIVKLREYRAVKSIRRYVIAEASSAGLTLLEKQENDDWKAAAPTGEDVLRLPEIGIELPLAELYDEVVFSGVEEQG